MVTDIDAVHYTGMENAIVDTMSRRYISVVGNGTR